jgi:hypothetical protein
MPRTRDCKPLKVLLLKALRIVLLENYEGEKYELIGGPRPRIELRKSKSKRKKTAAAGRGKKATPPPR